MAEMISEKDEVMFPELFRTDEQGRVRLVARNFAGVARKETPMSNPIQSKASVNTGREDLLAFRGFAIESANFA